LPNLVGEKTIMFYILSKFLPLLIYPIGLACVLLGVALWLRRRPKWRTALIATALAVLWLGSNRIVAMFLTRSLEGRYLPSAELRAYEVRADAIVVLGGATRTGVFPRSSSEINEAGDRLLYAARLYRQGVAPYLLLSGGRARIVETPSVPEAEGMAEILVEIGVPREAIWLETASRNTHENAVQSLAILQAQSVERIVLVTSASHMPRAVAVFAQTGLEVIPAATDFQVVQEDWAFYTRLNPLVQLNNLLPRAADLERTTRALKEYVGMVMYRLQGWL
jgi:uncharacterized SAM-binding protein YcdF (DUF218 family)